MWVVVVHSCRTPPTNETLRAKYNLVGFSSVFCKTTTQNEHFQDLEVTWLCDVKFFSENAKISSSGNTSIVL